MGAKSRKWINENMVRLKRKYPNKTVIVCEGAVIKALDGPSDPISINDVASEICRGKDWSYTFISESEEEYIL